MLAPVPFLTAAACEVMLIVSVPSDPLILQLCLHLQQSPALQPWGEVNIFLTLPVGAEVSPMANVGSSAAHDLGEAP